MMHMAFLHSTTVNACQENSGKSLQNIFWSLVHSAPAVLHTHWLKQSIVCSEKGRPWQIEFLHPAYLLVSGLHVAAVTYSKSLGAEQDEA